MRVSAWHAAILGALASLGPTDIFGHAFLVRISKRCPSGRLISSQQRVQPCSSTRLYQRKVRVSDLSSMTLEQLREGLKRRGLTTTGKKAELLERLRADIRRAYDEEMMQMGLGPPPLEPTEPEAGPAAENDPPSNERRGRKAGAVDDKEEKEEELDDEEVFSAARAVFSAQQPPPPPSVDPVQGQPLPMPQEVENYEDLVLDSLPDYEKSPKHEIRKRHLGWDGALQGYTLGDGTYVTVKENPRMSDKDLEKMDESLRKEVDKWKEDYPDDWEDFMSLIEAAEGGKKKGQAVGRLGGGEAREEDPDELEMMVREVERLEKERRAIKMPMAKAMEAWESQLALGREVSVIDKKDKGLKPQAEGQEEGLATALAPAPQVEDVEDETEEELVEEEGKEEEEEQEYVPIDAMFRDELEYEAADGQILKGYLVSSKLAQKFWRREERPVVLMLTDKCGWRKVQTRKLADHMAFLTNHVFFVPDLYRDDPWVEDGHETLEQWRARHPTLRLLQDARCALGTLVKNYNATATGIVGFGVGGGQALSAVASGFVETNAVVALCPQGYDASKVCNRMGTPVLTVFGGKDTTLGGRLDDSLAIMEGFAKNKALPYMIRIFKDEDGSFVMRPRAGHETAAEDALMLATSWLEIQMRGGRVKLIRDARVC